MSTKERQILFKGPMVRAILSGQKTQTRRVVTPQPEFATAALALGDCHSGAVPVVSTSPLGGGIGLQLPDDPATPNVQNRIGFVQPNIHCPYGVPGDRLWVRETWQHSNFPLGPYDDNCDVFYRADYLDDRHGADGEKSPEGKYRFWKPSIHMPRSACRILLEVTAVRVEQLNNISDADAREEGTCGGHGAIPDYNYAATASEHFQWLWEQTYGAGSWAANPWVWVIEFKELESV